MEKPYFFLTFFFLVSFCVHAQRCKFTKYYTQDQVLRDPEPFLKEFIQWEAKFIRTVGVNQLTGITYDGHRLDMNTGDLLSGGSHFWTASSKQSLHVGVLANILQTGKQDIHTYAQVFSLLKKKTQTLERFFTKYPGFGGFMPWVVHNGDTPTPTSDFASRTPSLDNGQLFWAALAVSHAWKTKHPYTSSDIRERWDNITWKLMLKNTRKIFYNQTTKKIRGVAQMRNASLPVSQNIYTNSDGYYLQDPYQGELFVWIPTLFSQQTGFTQAQIDLLWQSKRNMLKKVNFWSTTARASITVEKGWWFSSHEQWKNLFMPYSDSQTYFRIQKNNQRARTWNSVDKNINGMYASVTGPGKNNTANLEYYPDCGIPSVSFASVSKTLMVTAYSTFPLFLVNRNAGAVWLYNMLSSPAAQTIYGSIQATSTDGKDISPMLTWDAKVSTVLAVMGGNRDTIRKYLQSVYKYNTFISRVESEYKRQFNIIEGEFLGFANPTVTVRSGRLDFNNCKI